VVILMLMSVGMLLTRSKGRFVRSLIAATPTGMIARQLFGIALVPCLLGLLIVAS